MRGYKKAYFNEDSFYPLISTDVEFVNVVKSFLRTFQEIQKLGFLQLCVTADLFTKSWATGLSFSDAMKLFDKDERTLLFKIFNGPYIEQQFEVMASNNSVLCSDVVVEHPIGILGAAVNETLAVSLRSGSRWEESILCALVIDSNNQSQVTSYQIGHVSRLDHPKLHIAMCSRITPDREMLCPTADNPLPNTAMLDLFYNWEGFCLSNQSEPESKVARIREAAVVVANANGYALDQRLTQQNSRDAKRMRQIFRSELLEGNNVMFLSTDFENAAGAFEVYDFQGRHLGEWLFLGRRNKQADLKGRHNISV